MSFGLTMAGIGAALGPMVVPALTGAGIGLGTGLLTGDGFSDDDWWQNMLMGGLGGAAFGGMGGMDKLSGMFGSSATTGILPQAANPMAAAKPFGDFTTSIWGMPGKDAAGIAAMTGKQGAIPAGFNPANYLRPSGYDAAGLAALKNAQGPVQNAGLFSGGFKPGAYEIGARDAVSKFTPESGTDLLSTDNMYKGLIASSLMKNLRGQNDDIKPPPPISPSFPRAAPPPANVAGVRRPIRGGGFMGNQRGGLGSRRY